MRAFVREFGIAVAVTASLAVLTCALYPVAVFVTAQALFPGRANGSIVYNRNVAVGSSLLGQPFELPRYFHPRPSAAGAGYDATASGGSNLGPTSRQLIETVAARVAKYRAENGLSSTTEAPADAVTASGSGLDPDISVENALMQAPRVAEARGLDVAYVNEMIRNHTEGRDLGILGEPRVNVLLLNLALDESEVKGAGGNG